MSQATPSGWPYVTGDDFPVEWPLVSQQIAELLEERTRRVHAQQVRAGDAESGVDTAVPVAGTVRIWQAPPGVYLVTVDCDWKTTGPGSPVRWGVSAAITGDILANQWAGTFEQDTNYRQQWTFSRPFVNLTETEITVNATLRASLANIRIFEGGTVTLTRVSA